MRIDLDSSGFDDLAERLTRASAAASPLVTAAVEVTARHVKDDWREKVSGARGLPGLAAAVGYDLHAAGSLFGHADSITAIIGFDKSKYQGPLGNISEYGSPTVAPRGYGHAALHENEGDFRQGLSRALDDADRAGGL